MYLLINILVIAVIVGYTVFTLFKFFKRTQKGQCGSCHTKCHCETPDSQKSLIASQLKNK